MPRFVVLRHDPQPDTAQRLHWDLMLEAENVLHTWALSAEPSGGQAIAASQLPDHRKLYLDYEGPVSGDRGWVRRWDQGEYALLRQDERRITVRFNGQKLKATATLTREDESLSWTIEFVS